MIARRVRRACILLTAFVISCWLSPMLACAQERMAANDQPARTFVTLRVNAIEQGETVAVLLQNDVLLTASALSKAGVPLGSATHYKLYDDDFVSLASLGPKITFHFDSDDLIVDVNLPPELFGTKTIELAQTRPESFMYSHDRSAFLNYSLTADSTQGETFFTETGATVGAGRLYTSFTDSKSVGLDRGLSNLTFDAPDAMRTTILGDALATGGDLGGNPYLAGIQVGRAFSLNPYFVRFPTLAFSGSIAAPGRADVYVNGVLVRSVPLQPGQFSLQGIAPPSGAGNTQVVITDSLGHSTTYGGAYYSAESLLTKGLTDYQYSAGFLRPNAFGADDRYGPFGYVGSYRLGLTNSLTLGGRLEGTGNLVSGGPTLDAGTNFGTFHLAGGLSRSGPTGGAAADFAYGYATRRFGFSGAVMLQSDGYATTSLAPQTDRPLLSDTLSANFALTPRIGLSASLSRSEYRDSGTTSDASLYVGFSLGGINLNVGASRITNGGAAALTLPSGSSGTQYFLTMLLPAHGRTTETLTSTIGSGGTTNVAQIQEAVPVGVGFGYRAAISNDPNALLSTDERYNGPIGTYELTTGLPRGGAMASTFTLAGGIADVDGRVALSRPLTDSFALVDVPGQSHVDVFLNGQDMGTTDRSGKLVVPDVISNYDNRIDIDERSTAMDTEITSSREFIAPGVRSGALVAYGVRKVAAFSGKLLVRKAGKEVVPALGAFDLSKGTATLNSDLGDDAEFYFENLTPGKYRGAVRYASGTCRFDVTIPAATGLVTDVGTLTCVEH